MVSHSLALHLYINNKADTATKQREKLCELKFILINCQIPQISSLTLPKAATVPQLN